MLQEHKQTNLLITWETRWTFKKISS